MGNLHEVVELNALADDGRTHCRTVYTGVSADLNIVLDGHDANLRYLVVAFCVRSEAESVRTDYAASVKSYVVAELAALIDGRVRVDEAVVAHLHVVADYGVRIDLAVVAYNGVVADACKRTHIAVLAELCSRRYVCLRSNASLLRLACFIDLEQLGNTLVCVVNTYECGLNGVLKLYIVVDNHYRRLGVVDVVGVFRV